MKECNPCSFKDQTIYVGIDVHKRSWHVTERHCGLKLKSYSANPDPELLAEHLRRCYPDAKYKSVYEAGFCGFWIHKRLLACGIENIVINPADVPTSGKERTYKNDSVDSGKLARELECGSLVAIYIPPDENLILRNLVRHETQIVGNIVRCKNRIKSYFNFYGIPFKSWAGLWLKQLEFAAKEAHDETLVSFLRELRFLREERLRIIQAEKMYLKRTNRETIQKNLCSIPGIGFRSAIIIQAELWDIQRFKGQNALNAYVGVAPRLFGSGESEAIKSGGGRKKMELHYILIEVAWRAISLDMELRSVYGRISAKSNAAKAISVIARKMLGRIRAVLMQNRSYIIRMAEA